MRALHRARLRVDSEHLLLLKGLLLWSVVAFALLAAWHHGLVQRVWAGDRTGISAGITLVFLLAALSAARELWRLSRVLNHLEATEAFLWSEGALAYRRLVDGHWRDGRAPAGPLRDHVRDLVVKARGSAGRVPDQRLLLENLDAELRRGHGAIWFVADLLLSLGLLGTVIGFILMLAPISAIDAGDQAAIKDALAAMSDGMAVALYTTLAGLIGGLLLKVQGLLLDGGVDEVMRRTTRLCEVHILPSITQEQCHAA